MDIGASLLIIGGYLLNRLAKRLQAKVAAEKHAERCRSLAAQARREKSIAKNKKALEYWASLGNEEADNAAR